MIKAAKIPAKKRRRKKPQTLKILLNKKQGDIMTIAILAPRLRRMLFSLRPGSFEWKNTDSAEINLISCLDGLSLLGYSTAEIEKLEHKIVSACN